MRRSVFASAAAFTAIILVAPLAAAIGPGGWDHVGVGSTSTTPSLNGTSVTALNADNPGVLYVGGNFTNAGGHSTADRIARWNGTAWSAIGNTPLTNGQVFAIAYHAGKVYVGGTFQNAGGQANADFLAAWNGTTWSSPCNSPGSDPAITANVNALQIVDNTLYVGGSFQDGAGIAAADYLVGCDLTTGDASATVSTAVGDFSGAVYALTADSNGVLYAGGQFINLQGILAADHVAQYDGNQVWSAMGTGALVTDAAVDSFVRSLTASGTNVYVGTDSVNVATIPQADHVARWDGAAWHAVGSNAAGDNGWFASGFTIDALDTYGSILVAAGSFQNANGTATADNIAYFDGSHWRPIGSDGSGNGPLSAHPTSLGITGGKVYVGGNFTTAGGDTLARFVAAYALRQPDASIGATSTGSFVGNNVYSSTGSGETRTVTVTRGHSATAYVKIQNDGLVAATFKLTGTGSATGLSVHYFRGSTNITSAVRAGTYALPPLTARSNTVVRMVVTVAKSSASSATFRTTSRSQTGTPHDAVRFLVKATG
jgi:trimeric autotransporter adhesin